MTDEMKLNIEGYREFLRELRRIGPEFPKALQQENKKFAVEVASLVRQAYTALYTPRTGRGAASIRGLATQNRAEVAIGTARTPYMLGQEFGAGAADSGQGYARVGRTLYAKSINGVPLYGKSKRFTRSSMRQFPPYITSDSGRGGHGYFMYPTLRREVPKLIDRYGKAIDLVTRRAFGSPEVTYRG